MSLFDRQQVNDLINGTQPSSFIDVNTTMVIVDPIATAAATPTSMYSIYMPY